MSKDNVCLVRLTYDSESRVVYCMEHLFCQMRTFTETIHNTNVLRSCHSYFLSISVPFITHSFSVSSSTTILPLNWVPAKRYGIQNSSSGHMWSYGMSVS